MVAWREKGGLVLKRLDFPALDRPYLVANFVQTLDGKVQGPGAEYWPIGSEADFESLMDLRAQCDVLLHGRSTALSFNHLGRLSSPEFTARLEHLGRKTPYTYMVLSAHPDSVLLQAIDPKTTGIRVVLVTTEGAALPKVPRGVAVWRCGDGADVDLELVRSRMGEAGFRMVALEAGPRLFGAFVAEKLVDELLLTIAPKLFGTAFGTPTIINGLLFKPAEVPLLELVSVKSQDSELFLRYKFREVRA